MSRQAFLVFVDLPDGVSLGEFASHLADAHRSQAANYRPDDLLSTVENIEVFASVASADLPASVDSEEPVTRLKVVGQP